MEKIKQTVLQVERLYTRICELLEPFDRQYGAAAYDILEDATSVRDLADGIIRTDLFTNPELSSLLSSQKSFNRHLSEVEQAVYENIGSADYERLLTIIDGESEYYNNTYDYLGLGKNN